MVNDNGVGGASPSTDPAGLFISKEKEDHTSRLG